VGIAVHRTTEIDSIIKIAFRGPWCLGNTTSRATHCCNGNTYGWPELQCSEK